MRALLTSLFLLATPAAADCVGQNLFRAMPPADRAALNAATNAVPYPQGNFWTATRGDARLTVVGTYHLDDPRHDQTMATIGPLIDTATIVLVEGGPAEEAALKARMMQDPSVIIQQDGSLPQQLSPEDWAHLSTALKKRGIPPVVAARFQPWYVAVMLGIPACKIAAMAQPNGLDARVIARATAAAVPIRALEPYDTVFRIFDGISFADQIDMIRSTLALEDRGDDFAITMADSYFSGESRLIWELMRAETATLPGYTPARAEAEFAVMEEALMASRNRAWITVIEQAADDGPTLAAFGALHLSGTDGVLARLERGGWALAPLPLAP